MSNPGRGACLSVIGEIHNISSVSQSSSLGTLKQVLLLLTWLKSLLVFILVSEGLQNP